MNQSKLFFALCMMLAVILVPVWSVAAPAPSLAIDKDGILLQANLPEGQKNVLKVSVPPVYGWFSEEYNPSTGYTWRFIPDKSGVYKLVKQFTLQSTIVNMDNKPLVGLPAKTIWVFQAIKAGKGVATFAQYAPGKKTPARTEKVVILVK
jgi:predicted secreted protein